MIGATAGHAAHEDQRLNRSMTPVSLFGLRARNPPADDEHGPTISMISAHRVRGAFEPPRDIGSTGCPDLGETTGAESANLSTFDSAGLERSEDPILVR